MKKALLSIATSLALTGGALLAQTTNTTAPGPTQERGPSQVNNNLPNPGNPIANPAPAKPATDSTMTDTSANGMTHTEPMAPSGSTDSTGAPTATGSSTYGTSSTGTTTTGTGSSYGTSSTGTTTGTGSTYGSGSTSGTGTGYTTGSRRGMSGGAATDTTGMSTDTTTTDSSMNNGSTHRRGRMPRTASELPMFAAIGLLALGMALTLRTLTRRNNA